MSTFVLTSRHANSSVLCQQDILRDYDTILWMDSSFRLFEPHLRPAISMALENRYGAVLFTKVRENVLCKTLSNGSTNVELLVVQTYCISDLL